MKKLLLLLSLCLLTSCATFPVLGPVFTPSWDQATKSSCWTGANAAIRNMNILSPHMSESTFKARVSWMKNRDCNTAHVFVSNKSDGEHAGYSIYGSSAWDWTIDNNTCKVFRDRIAYLRNNGLAVVIWLFADDSSVWNKEASKNFPKYLEDCDDQELFKYASTVVVGLELDEYYSASQVGQLVAATRKVYGGKIGTHMTSYKTHYAALGDVFFYQVNPGMTIPQLLTEAQKVKGVGKPVNFFEIERQEARDKSKALLESKLIYGVGNW